MPASGGRGGRQRSDAAMAAGSSDGGRMLAVGSSDGGLASWQLASGSHFVTEEPPARKNVKVEFNSGEWKQLEGGRAARAAEYLPTWCAKYAEKHGITALTYDIVYCRLLVNCPIRVPIPSVPGRTAVPWFHASSCLRLFHLERC